MGIEQIKRWNELSGIDYYIQFIKVWIPFNAWYVNMYGDDKSDRFCITKIQDNSQIKDSIIALLDINNTEDNAIELRKALASLHNELKNNAFPNAKNKITFNSVDLGISSENNVREIKNKDHYIINRYTENNPEGKPNKSIKIELMNDKQETIFLFNQKKYDWEEIESNAEYKHLSQKRKNNLEHLYLRINPRLILNMEEVKNRGIELGEKVFFINNKELISKAIIEILYLLRCKIFHGEMIPSDNNKLIYKNAYQILSVIIKKNI